MGLSRTVSTRDGNFSRNFVTPLYFMPPLKGSLGIGYWCRDQKTRMMGLLARERSLTISSAVWIQSTNVTDRWTDGHRATAKTVLTHSVTWQLYIMVQGSFKFYKTKHTIFVLTDRFITKFHFNNDRKTNSTHDKNCYQSLEELQSTRMLNTICACIQKQYTHCFNGHFSR